MTQAFHSSRADSRHKDLPRAVRPGKINYRLGLIFADQHPSLDVQIAGKVQVAINR